MRESLMNKLDLGYSRNLRRYLAAFEYARGLYEELLVAMDALRRIFYGKDYLGGPDTLPKRTSLMRAYKNHMKEGGEVGCALGFRAGAEG